MISLTPKSGMPGITFPAVPGIKAAAVLAMQYQLEASQWFSVEEMEARQLQQFNIVLRHAARHVPYYQQLFAQCNISVPEAVDRNFFASLPILSRKNLQEAGDQINASKAVRAHGKTRVTATSGSTGVPVRVQISEINDFFWRAHALRDHAWHRSNLLGKLAAIRWAPKGQAVAPLGVDTKGWGPITDIAFTSGPACFLNIDTPVAEQIKWLQWQQPDILLSFPSNLIALATYCIEHHIQLDKLKEVRTIGESLRPESRALFKKAWNVTVVDTYSCEEMGYLALQCPLHDHYHVMSENIILEVLNENNQPCQTGEIGRVLITNLHNFHTPLIRYELGDMAEVGEACACGRTLPVLKRIFGRKRNRLILPSGESRFAYLGEHGQFEKACGVKPREFQFVQTDLENIEVKLVIDPLNKKQEKALAKLVNENFGYPFKVSFSYHDHIERGPSGKFEEFISLVE